MSILDKVGEIVKAWAIARNPNPEQLQLANGRYEICMSCPFLTKGLANTNLEYLKCDKCGCPISKKIFSANWNACPTERWLDVENDYFKLSKKTDSKKTML